jgi:hypothetical protein
MSAFNFPPEHRDPVVFLACKWARELQDDETMPSVVDFDDEEIRQAIVQDIMSATFWEKQTGEKLSFDFEELVRFVNPASRARVEEQIKHGDVQELIVEVHGQLRLRDQRSVEQAAMDFCGVYYDGYEMPYGVLKVDRSAIAQAIEDHGGINQFADSLKMDLQSNVPLDKKEH